MLPLFRRRITAPGVRHTLLPFAMGLISYLKTQFILQLLISFVFVVSGLIINFIQLCTCVLWPFNRQLYRRINCRLAYSLWSRESALKPCVCHVTCDGDLCSPALHLCRALELVMLLEWWSCTDCTLYTDKATMDKLGKEHVIIILNHNFEIDFLCGWTMCERFGVLGVSVWAVVHQNMA